MRGHTPGSQVLRAESVKKSFSGVPVLHGVSFDLRAGEVHVLAGENGAGKSTLIKILSGVHDDYEGELRLDGEPIRLRSPFAAARRGISVIHQELSLIGALDAVDNIFLGRELASGAGWMQHAAQRERARAICARLGLELDLSAPVETHSLAVKNQLEIAKALAFDARILIMDEPTSALGRAEAAQLFAQIDALRARGCAIVYISHRMEEIYRLADRITVLRDGRSVGTWDAHALPQGELVRRMIGRELNEYFPPRTPRPGAIRLAVEGLRVPGAGARPWAIDDVSFSVRAGEILGVAGLQGSGHHELLEGLFGASAGRVQGTVKIDGVAASVASPAGSIRRGLALLTADRKDTGIVPALGIRENVTLASLPSVSRFGWLRRSLENAAADAAIRDLDIRCHTREQPIASLSGGNQQKAILGRWLRTGPRVLLLSEPTRGVDVGARHQIYELMNRCTEQGIAIVLVSSDLPELLGLSDRIITLHRGRLSGEFTRDEATAERVLRAAMGVAGGAVDGTEVAAEDMAEEVLPGLAKELPGNNHAARMAASERAAAVAAVYKANKL